MRRLLPLLGLIWVILPYRISTVEAAPIAQSGNRINFGETVTGTITAEEFRQLYIFSGRQGQVVSISMNNQGGDLDPYLILTSSESVVIATSDDEAGNRNASIISQNLPADGDYFIIATRFGHERGLTTGDYSLRLDLVGASAMTSNFELRSGDAILGQITDTQSQIVYTLNGTRGQVITIRMSRTSGDLDPLLDLFDPNRTLLISGDDDPASFGSRNAGIIEYMLPMDGIYYIRATRYGYESGVSNGTFLLQITETPPEMLGDRPLTARYIAYGDTYIGVIGEDIFTRFFQFEATRGDVISVIATRRTGNVSLQVSLLDADSLRTISISETGAGREEASLLGISIPETGRYLLLVTRYQGADGTSIGEFELTLSGRAGIAGDSRLEVTYGVRIQGEITDEKYLETYSFVGQAGDIITITMRRIEGNLDSLLTLQDETGKTISFDDDGVGEGSKDSIIRRFRLPSDGIYTIEASRYERLVGKTIGFYELSLEKNN